MFNSFTLCLYNYYLPEYSFPSLCNLERTLEVPNSSFSLLFCSLFLDVMFSDRKNVSEDFIGVSVATITFGDLTEFSFAAFVAFTVE